MFAVYHSWLGTRYNFPCIKDRLELAFSVNFSAFSCFPSVHFTLPILR
jgi:hypothetical protein